MGESITCTVEGAEKVCSQKTGRQKSCKERFDDGERDVMPKLLLFCQTGKGMNCINHSAKLVLIYSAG